MTTFFESYTGFLRKALSGHAADVMPGPSIPGPRVSEPGYKYQSPLAQTAAGVSSPSAPASSLCPVTVMTVKLTS
jgi:hypothetical protein